MNLTGGAVLFVVLWFLTLFIVVLIGQRSQQDAGYIVPGTHAGAHGRSESETDRDLDDAGLWRHLGCDRLGDPQRDGDAGGCGEFRPLLALIR